jgi:hypothetical protein
MSDREAGVAKRRLLIRGDRQETCNVIDLFDDDCYRDIVEDYVSKNGENITLILFYLAKRCPDGIVISNRMVVRGPSKKYVLRFLVDIHLILPLRMFRDVLNLNPYLFSEYPTIRGHEDIRLVSLPLCIIYQRKGGSIEIVEVEDERVYLPIDVIPLLYDRKDISILRESNLLDKDTMFFSDISIISTNEET